MISAQPVSLAEWVKRHSRSLAGFEPDLDHGDLESLKEMVENARIVAIGEGAHFVNEFSYMRQRLLRFLSEQCGFNVFGFEYSFSNAEGLNDWLQYRDDRRLEDVAPDAAQWGARDLMRWLRNHNALGRAPLRFVGIDLPEAGGALRPVLEPLAEILAQADTESEESARRAITISDRFLADVDSAAAAAPAWARLPPAARDELSRLLSHLELRISAVQSLMRNRVGGVMTDRAERLVAAARATNYMFAAMDDLMANRGKTADMSIRDRFMADTLLWHLNRAGDESKIVVAAHNNHIQKTENVFGDITTALPMGQHLANALGDEYVSVALTHTDDEVPEMVPDSANGAGFRIENTPAAKPTPNSIEHALASADLHRTCTMTDLRPWSQDSDTARQLTSIRTQSSTMSTNLAQAFDAIIALPSISQDPTVSF